MTPPINRHVLLDVFIYIAFFGFDVFFVWPYSHTGAVWSGVALIVGTLVIAPGVAYRSAWSISVVLLGIGIQYFLPPTESGVHGWLRPGRIGAPHVACPLGEGRLIYLGTFVGKFANPYGDRLVVLASGKEDLLTISNHYDGLAISARLFDENGIIAEIVDNEFTLNPNNIFRVERPDLHTLVVFDRWAKPVLRVEYLNPQALRISGTLVCPGLGKMVIEDSGITAYNLQAQPIVTMRDQCGLIPRGAVLACFASTLGFNAFGMRNRCQ